jgi:hypothetical protein
LIEDRIDIFLNYAELEPAFSGQNLSEKKQRRVDRKLKEQNKKKVGMLKFKSLVVKESC